MAQLLVPKTGRQSEHLAKYILSKFNFIAEPLDISDDIGTDLFCTLYEISEGKYLLPRNSYAVQIKSNKSSINVTSKLKYLHNLEIPYFVGVVNKEGAVLTIYSGEALCHFFTLYGNPTEKTNMHYSPNNKIFISLHDSLTGNNFNEKIGNKFYIKFYKILELNDMFDYLNNPAKLNDFKLVSSLIQDNISSMKSKSYIYKVWQNPRVFIYAGSGSVKTFRDNFFNRLCEVFYNLRWIYTGQKDSFKIEEFQLFKRLYLEIKDYYKNNVPNPLTHVFTELERLINNDA